MKRAIAILVLASALVGCEADEKLDDYRANIIKNTYGEVTTIHKDYFKNNYYSIISVNEHPGNGYVYIGNVKSDSESVIKKYFDMRRSRICYKTEVNNKFIYVYVDEEYAYYDVDMLEEAIDLAKNFDKFNK